MTYHLRSPVIISNGRSQLASFSATKTFKLSREPMD
jgi:hypothetical protein